MGDKAHVCKNAWGQRSNYCDIFGSHGVVIRCNSAATWHFIFGRVAAHISKGTGAFLRTCTGAFLRTGTGAFLRIVTGAFLRTCTGAFLRIVTGAFLRTCTGAFLRTGTGAFLRTGTGAFLRTGTGAFLRTGTGAFLRTCTGAFLRRGTSAFLRTCTGAFLRTGTSAFLRTGTARPGTQCNKRNDSNLQESSGTVAKICMFSCLVWTASSCDPSNHEAHHLREYTSILSPVTATVFKLISSFFKSLDLIL